ncbi:hypothetical protein D3C74_481120 [compost metagenome]
MLRALIRPALIVTMPVPVSVHIHVIHILSPIMRSKFIRSHNLAYTLLGHECLGRSFILEVNNAIRHGCSE